MSAHAMKPTFNDIEGYRSWKATWRGVYKQMSADIRKAKRALKDARRTAPQAPETRKAQHNLALQRVMASKMMGLLKDARVRWERILEMKRQIETQNAQFPITISKAPNIDVHFNRIHNEFPFMPMWVVKAKGMSFYVHHIEFENVSFSTKERDEGSTKGLLRFKRCEVAINAEGVATIYARADLAQAA